MFLKLWYCQKVWYLFPGLKTIILCSVHSTWFVKYLFSAKLWFVKTSTRIVKYESRDVNRTLVVFDYFLGLALKRLKFLKKCRQFRCACLLRRNKLVHLDSKDWPSFTWNLVQNLMSLALASKGNREWLKGG